MHFTVPFYFAMYAKYDNTIWFQRNSVIKMSPLPTIRPVHS